MKSWAGRAAEALMHGSVPGKHGGGGGGGVGRCKGNGLPTICGGKGTAKHQSLNSAGFKETHNVG